MLLQKMLECPCSDAHSEHLNLSGVLPPVAAAAHPLASEMGIFSPEEKTSTGGFRGEATSLSLALILFMP